MKIETKGIFEALPNCMSLQEIIEYLDSRNYAERKAKEEYHEMYEEGQINYTEFERSSILLDDRIVHQPSWLIVPSTTRNDVWVRGTVVCYFHQKDELVSDSYLGQIKCKHSIKRSYTGVVRCPYTELTPQRLESMLTESIRNIKSIIDEVRYDDVENTDDSKNTIPIILRD